MTTLGQILDRLHAIADEVKENYDSVAEGGVHRTVVFVRLPAPKAVVGSDEVMERLNRFLSSLNQADTIKADVFTIIGKHILPGYQPYTELQANGPDDADDIRALLDFPYVLQVTVDVVQPDVLEATLDALTE